MGQLAMADVDKIIRAELDKIPKPVTVRRINDHFRKPIRKTDFRFSLSYVAKGTGCFHVTLLIRGNTTPGPKFTQSYKVQRD